MRFQTQTEWIPSFWIFVPWPEHYIGPCHKHPKIYKNFNSQHHHKESFKFQVWLQENYGNISGKNWSDAKLMLLILWRNFRKLFWNNFNEIGKKLRRNLKKTLKEYRKNFLQIKQKKHFDGNFRKFLKELTNNCTETSNNSRKNLWYLFYYYCRGILKKFWKYWGALENLSRDVSEFNPALSKPNLRVNKLHFILFSCEVNNSRENYHYIRVGKH